MDWLKEIWLSLTIWYMKRQVKKRIDKLGSGFEININDLPVGPIEPSLRDGNETDAFMKGF